MHPLGLCNNNDEEDLYEYGWVGVVKLEQPELDPKPCLTVLGKVSTGPSELFWFRCVFSTHPFPQFSHRWLQGTAMWVQHSFLAEVMWVEDQDVSCSSPLWCLQAWTVTETANLRVDSISGPLCGHGQVISPEGISLSCLRNGLIIESHNTLSYTLGARCFRILRFEEFGKVLRYTHFTLSNPREIWGSTQ